MAVAEFNAKLGNLNASKMQLLQIHFWLRRVWFRPGRKHKELKEEAAPRMQRHQGKTQVESDHKRSCGCQDAALLVEELENDESSAQCGDCHKSGLQTQPSASHTMSSRAFLQRNSQYLTASKTSVVRIPRMEGSSQCAAAPTASLISSSPILEGEGVPRQQPNLFQLRPPLVIPERLLAEDRPRQQFQKIPAAVPVPVDVHPTCTQIAMNRACHFTFTWCQPYHTKGPNPNNSTTRMP